MRTTHIIDSNKLPAPVEVVGEQVTILAEGDRTKPFEVHVQEGVEGGGPPPHFHAWDEAFYVLEGEVELSLEGEAHLLGAGSYVHIPGNTVHAYTNRSPTARILGIVSDPKGGDLFRAIDKIRIPDEMPRLLETAAQCGVTFMPPDETS
jgi:quercetin dioxygenase-like cupin family protein